MASAWGLDVIPHGGGLHPWGLHFILSTVNCPLAEWVVIGNEGEADPIRPLFPYLDGAPVPVDGVIRPTRRTRHWRHRQRGLAHGIASIRAQPAQYDGRHLRAPDV